MLPFDLVFPDLARRECFVIEVCDARSRPAGIVVFREFYCNEPGCDCRRVVLHAAITGKPGVVAGIGYGFEPALPPFDDEPQSMLDPLNPQSELSDHVLNVFTKVVEREPSVRERFVEHYRRWKDVIDNPAHPDHAKVRSEYHDDPTFRPAYAPRAMGFAPNQRCHCRSGKKFKNCCGRRATTAERLQG
jgi:hypothetical protein